MAGMMLLYIILGFIFLLIILYFLYRYFRGKPKAPANYPSDSYMREVGLRCPDYWVYNQEKGVCVNQFNIPVNDPKTCYDQNNEKKFKEIRNWPVNTNEFDEVLKGRCEWLRECGPTKKIPASWVGVDQHC